MDRVNEFYLMHRHRLGWTWLAVVIFLAACNNGGDGGGGGGDGGGIY